MTLSSGTLNLKFMQRAAARQQQSPATPQTSIPSSTGAQAVSVTPTPNRDQKPSIQAGRFDVLDNAEAGPSTPAPVTTELILTPAEREARWSIPRRATPRDDSRSGGSSWEFESGYMSVLLPAEVRSEGSGGGGRMAFGGFGKRDEEEITGDQADEDGHEANGDAQNHSEDVEPRKRPRPTDASPGTPALASSSRTFIKPDGFDDRPPRPTASIDDKTQLRHANQLVTAAASSSDSTSPRTGSGSSERRKKRKGAPGQQLKVSQADRLRATISNARKANGSGSSTPNGSSLASQVERGPVTTPNTTNQPIDLTGSPSPPPTTPDETADRPNQKRKKKRKNKDRESILGIATPTSLASGTSSSSKSVKSTPRGGSPDSPSASTLDQKQAQMKADKRRRRRERKKLKQESGLKIEGDEMN